MVSNQQRSNENKETSAKVRYYRNYANQHGIYPTTKGWNQHKINSIKRRARLPAHVINLTGNNNSLASTEPYSPSNSSRRTESARTSSASSRSSRRSRTHRSRGPFRRFTNNLLRRHERRTRRGTRGRGTRRHGTTVHRSI
jgi:hypothetical protein